MKHSFEQMTCFDAKFIFSSLPSFYMHLFTSVSPVI